MPRRLSGIALIEIRTKIVYLREECGLPWKEIANMFKADHTTMIYHYQRAKFLGLDGQFVAIPKKKEEPKKPRPKYEHLHNEKINVGQSYKDYIAASDQETQARHRAVFCNWRK